MLLRDRIGKYLPALASRPKLSRNQAMSLAPVRNRLVAWVKTDSDEILLTIPRRSDRLGRLMSFIFRIPESKELLLDEVGGSVWELCDGKHNIGQVIAATSERYKLNRREAEVSVTTYIKMLAQRNLVGLAQRGGKVPHGRRKQS